MYYGCSPFYWSWEYKFNTVSTSGDFFYDEIFEKYFVCFYFQDEENFKNHLFKMTYKNVKVMFVPIENISNLLTDEISNNKLLPVLGQKIACATSLKKELYQFICKQKLVLFNPVKHNKFKTNHETTLAKNKKILKHWLGDDLQNTCKDKINLLCFFHNDHNPSAVYNFKTGFFKCFACGKSCKNLYVNLKKIKHVILKNI